MTDNLLNATWTDFDSAELSLLLDMQIGGPGQYEDHTANSARRCLPLAGESCRVAIRLRDNRIVAIEAGPAFNAREWDRISHEIEYSILAGPMKVGREFSFSSFRVTGSWRGRASGLQILPPSETAPRAPVELAAHPFVLEFPIKSSDSWPLANHRRTRQHRRLTLLLNVLLAGSTSFQPRRTDHSWMLQVKDDGTFENTWAQQSFMASLGRSVTDDLSPEASELLVEVDPKDFDGVGHDGRPLRVPADLDDWVCRYRGLSFKNQPKFDRATFWFEMASRQWNLSMSNSFAALVSSIEALTERGNSHRFDCPVCGNPTQHEQPGATSRFKAFLEIYAPGESEAKRRSEMYSLRSGILHGSDLMQLDQDIALGSNPAWWTERELHAELWHLTRVSLRNWLKAHS